MAMEDENCDENFCVLLHNQRVIQFCSVVKDDLLITKAHLFYYNAQEGQFWPNRTEKCETFVKSGKFEYEKTQCAVVKDLNLGIRLPVVTININSKKNSYLYAFVLDYTRKIGSQLRICDHFPLQSALDADLIIRDGPSFVYSKENRLNLVYFCSTVYKMNQILPVCVGNFVFLDGNNSNLYFIDGNNGFLMSFCVEKEELINHGALVDDFGRKYAGKVDGVNVELNFEDLKQSVVYVCCHSQLDKFQNGRLVRNTFFPLSGEIVDICLFKRFDCDFLMILCSDGTLSAVNDESFELVNRWSDVERFGVDDVLATGNKSILIEFKSLVSQILYKLNEKSIVTDVVDVFYPKEESARENDGKMCSAAKAIENKLRFGEFMLEEAKSRLNEKEECVERGMARLQELSANGVVNSNVFNSHIIDIISPENSPANTTYKTSTTPLKIVELNEKIYKQHWLIRLKLRNQSYKTLGNFSLHLLSDNPVQFTVKFYRDEIFGAKNLGLTNLLEFKNYFSSESPTIENQESIELIAVIPLTQPIFEKLTVAVQISIIFTEIDEQNPNQKQLQQLIGSVTHRFDDVIQPTQQHFDIWALSTTERSITLEIHSTETDLTTIRHLLTANLTLETNENIFYFQNDHPLAAIAIQTSSKMANRSTRIRVYYNSETELIFLLHLIYSKLPPDVIVTPFTGDLQALTNILTTNLSQELEIIRAIIQNQAKSQIPPFLDEKNPEKSLQNLRRAFTDRQKWLHEARSGKIDYKTYKNLKNQLETVEIQTDVNIGLFSHINVPYYK